jgi:hypothetical protein
MKMVTPLKSGGLVQTLVDYPRRLIIGETNEGKESPNSDQAIKMYAQN